MVETLMVSGRGWSERAYLISPWKSPIYICWDRTTGKESFRKEQSKPHARIGGLTGSDPILLLIPDDGKGMTESLLVTYVWVSVGRKGMAESVRVTHVWVPQDGKRVAESFRVTHVLSHRRFTDYGKSVRITYVRDPEHGKRMAESVRVTHVRVHEDGKGHTLAPFVMRFWLIYNKAIFLSIHCIK